MPSDRRDAGSTWEGPSAPQTNWNQTPEQVPARAQEEATPLSDRGQGGALHRPMPDAMQDEEGGEEADAAGTGAASGPAARLLEQLKHFGQYITLIIVPILFGALTCLFVLPRVAAGQASVPAEGFWPILLVIVAITIAQGVTVYYAGTDNGMWMLGTIGGLCLFVLVGSFALFGALVGFLMLVGLIVLAAVLAPRCLHPVSQGYVDIVFVSGKYRRTLYPGFNILLPWEKVFRHLNTEEVQWICPAQVVQLSHDDDVMLRAVISYQLLQEDAYLAVTQVRNWEDSLRTLFITTLQGIATVFRPDDFLAWPHGMRSQQAGDDDFTGSFERRQGINTHLFRLVSDRAALWGVQVNWVSIRDVELTPHGAVPIHEPPEPAPTPKQMPAAEPTPAPKPKQEEKAPAAQPQPQPQPQPQTRRPEAPAASRPNPAPTPKPAEQPAAAQQTTVPATQFKEDVLIQAYKEVQNGHVTDPETIRGIASRFEMVAQDHDASQMVSFDAQRAALNLYEQARKYEEEYAKNEYSQDTQPDWIARRPTDENLMAGG